MQLALKTCDAFQPILSSFRLAFKKSFRPFVCHAKWFFFSISVLSEIKDFKCWLCRQLLDRVRKFSCFKLNFFLCLKPFYLFLVRIFVTINDVRRLIIIKLLENNNRLVPLLHKSSSQKHIWPFPELSCIHTCCEGEKWFSIRTISGSEASKAVCLHQPWTNLSATVMYIAYIKYSRNEFLWERTRFLSNLPSHHLISCGVGMERVWNKQMKRNFVYHLRVFACRTIFTQHPLHVIRGGWSLGRAV